jgi:hypothetical protein
MKDEKIPLLNYATPQEKQESAVIGCLIVFAFYFGAFIGMPAILGAAIYLIER